jgi:hypothetical protein
MKRRRLMVYVLAVALAFAGGAGPRHARAATQNHDHAAITGTIQSHDHASGQHSHSHDAAASSHAKSFAKGGSHDHAGSQPMSDQGCCYAWCNSVAVIPAAEWLSIGTTHNEHFTSKRPFQIVAFSTAIDPPPR